MSGGFFRGTSADQDTRFSNKQAKLLKSQKFAPELENLVDMTKVKMDVMRPWIAKRVTELIGFEDEVLINYIYTLLEGKEVKGKQLQISLTGFMERNTGKFMKELWVLLLSAQQNVSGVPQQFLDAKEEETKSKKAETDRIANEIQKKKEKEKQEVEQEKTKMGGDGARPRDKHLELNVKDDAGGSSSEPSDEKERYKRNGRRRHGRDSKSPDSIYHSPSLRQRSRSISGAPPSRSRSISSERRYRRSPKRSVTPQRRHIIRRSPSLRRSPYSKRRSASHSRPRSPSPTRYRSRSPVRRRSRSPVRRRSRSPVRRRSRSPVRRRSRSPIRRSSAWYNSRTPFRRRSPSPVRRRSPSPVPHRSLSPKQGRSTSPVKVRSPFFRGRRSSVARRSPSPRQKSPSPARRRYQRSPSTPGEKSASPVRFRSSMHGRKRSVTPDRLRSKNESSSPSDTRHSSLSPVRRSSVVQIRGERARRHEKYSPARRASPKEVVELPVENREGSKLLEHRPLVSLRSPQRDMLDHDNILGKERELSPSIRKSPLTDASNHVSSASLTHKDSHNSPEDCGPNQGTKSEKSRLPTRVPDRLYREELHERQDLSNSKTTCLSLKVIESNDDGARPKEDKKVARLDDTDKLSMKTEKNGSFDSPTTKENDEYTVKLKEKRKHKKSRRQDVESDDYSSYESSEERKKAKRRRKEEKKLKKEGRHRRREERRDERRRKNGSHAEKLQLKSGDAGGLPSDLARDQSEDESFRRKVSPASYTDEADHEQKKLEIELREKALESLRAKKGIGN